MCRKRVYGAIIISAFKNSRSLKQAPAFLIDCKGVAIHRPKGANSRHGHFDHGHRN